jgi:mRNA interferase MazF
VAGLRRGDIRLYQFSKPDKRRPVLILTREGVIEALDAVLVASITSTIRGVDSEVYLDEQDGMKNPCVVNLHNLNTVRKKALGPPFATLSRLRMDEICAALAYSCGCDSYDLG